MVKNRFGAWIERLANAGVLPSDSEQERLRDAYELVERGSIEVKGKGPMRTYFLTGRRGEAAPAAASVELPAATRAIETRPALT